MAKKTLIKNGQREQRRDLKGIKPPTNKLVQEWRAHEFLANLIHLGQMLTPPFEPLISAYRSPVGGTQNEQLVVAPVVVKVKCSEASVLQGFQ